MPSDFFNRSRLFLLPKGMHQSYTIGYTMLHFKNKHLTVLHSAKMDCEEKKKKSFLIITSCQCGFDPSFVACFIHPFRDEQRWHLFTRIGEQNA